MELLNASGSRMLGADGSQLVRGDDGGMYLVCPTPLSPAQS